MTHVDALLERKYGCMWTACCKLIVQIVRVLRVPFDHFLSPVFTLYAMAWTWPNVTCYFKSQAWLATLAQFHDKPIKYFAYAQKGLIKISHSCTELQYYSIASFDSNCTANILCN